MVFPHQLSWLLDNPVRRLLLSPSRLADGLHLSETSRVLEIGPGSGFISTELAKRTPRGEVVLVDVQPAMLAKAKRKLDSEKFVNVRYLVADAGEGLPCRNGSFDAALLVCVLGEISNRQSCVRSLHRVLRLGGRLVVHESLPDPDMLSFQTIRTLAEAEGFSLVRRWGHALKYTALFERTAKQQPNATPPSSESLP